jgi:Fe-S-cluster containining protein
MIEQALRDLPAVKSRIVAGTAKVCPMLHLETGACLIYDARPIACRTYGFYAERGAVLGCFRIETLAQQSPDTIWGNHPAVQASLDAIGPAKGLSAWLEGAEWGSES